MLCSCGEKRVSHPALYTQTTAPSSFRRITYGRCSSPPNLIKCVNFNMRAWYWKKFNRSCSSAAQRTKEENVFFFYFLCHACVCVIPLYTAAAWYAFVKAKCNPLAAARIMMRYTEVRSNWIVCVIHNDAGELTPELCDIIAFDGGCNFLLPLACFLECVSKAYRFQSRWECKLLLHFVHTMKTWL